MKKIIRLTESDLIKLVDRVLTEQEQQSLDALKQQRREMRQNQRADRRDMRQNIRTARRNERAERDAIYDITALRDELNTIVATFNALSKHQNTDTYKKYYQTIANTLKAVTEFVKTTTNPTVPEENPVSDDENLGRPNP